jgi:hypothetical protein
MLRVTSTLTKLDPTKEFYTRGKAFQDHFKTTYLDTGLCISEDRQVSEDSLTVTSINIWKDAESFDLFLNDIVVQVSNYGRKQYNLLAGIEMVNIAEEINDE